MQTWEWMASDYLDCGEWGILNGRNEIVLGIGLGLSVGACRQIAENHNRDLRNALHDKSTAAVAEAVAREREACAKIADGVVQISTAPVTFQAQISYFASEVAKTIAAAIRARATP